MHAPSPLIARVPRVFTVTNVEVTLDLAEQRVSAFKDECDKLQTLLAETRRLYREHFSNIPVRSHMQ